MAAEWLIRVLWCVVQFLVDGS
ncbi:hypothetical protein OIU79_030324 [Salix purpurea]|uniref:Uncharacterized protein n=1 Tax=Salix purpurea TaxID=77065 RepID=A0A9Q0V8B0_SALPP|nr:hypothetical protein OIU79_030324 [Salix purpurea]